MASNNHRNGTSTYSMSLGLAAILNERDLVSPVGDKAGLKMNSRATPDRLSMCSQSESVTSSIGASGQSTTVSSPSDSQSKKFLDKIRGTGSSLYGFLSSNTWGLKSAADTSTVSASAGYSMATGANSTSVLRRDNNPDGAEPVKQTNAALSNPTQGQAIGTDSVLDALTSFRRGGIL